MNSSHLAANHLDLMLQGSVFSSRIPKGRSRSRHLIITFLISLFLTGCLVIPTPEHTLLEGRGQINEADMLFLELGKTTRDEILLRFGEPDLILNQDRIMIYHWSVSHGYWFVGAYYSGAGGPIPKDYLFMIEFDENGVLNRLEKIGSFLKTAQARIDQWVPPDMTKTTSLNRETFFISPAPEASRVDPPVSPVRFQVGKFSYLKDDPSSHALIGHKTAAFGVIVADVITFRRPVDLVRSAVISQLEAAGHHLVDQDAEVTISGDLTEFGVRTEWNLATWNAIGLLDVTLTVRSLSSPADQLERRYQSYQVVNTFFGPTLKDFDQVMRTCLEDMQKQMASDTEFLKLREK